MIEQFTLLALVLSAVIPAVSAGVVTTLFPLHETARAQTMK
jgi:hypothetical protein